MRSRSTTKPRGNSSDRSKVIKQLNAKRILTELKLRRAAGQHRLAQEMLKKFPTDETSAKRSKKSARSSTNTMQATAARVKILSQLSALAAKLGDPVQRKRVDSILKEMNDGLSVNTLDRLAAFREMSDDSTIPPADKLALAVSGWLLGSKSALPRLSTALSLVEVRQTIRKYLQTTDKPGREGLVLGLRSEEGASPPLVAKLLANMAPPVGRRVAGPTKRRRWRSRFRAPIRRRPPPAASCNFRRNTIRAGDILRS